MTNQAAAPAPTPLHPSGHLDGFARAQLPPCEQWPAITLEGVYAVPARLNAAVELLDRAIEEGHGDRVAIVIPQRFETAIAYMAVFQLGAVAMPLSMLFGPDALQYRLYDSEAVVAICWRRRSRMWPRHCHRLMMFGAMPRGCKLRRTMFSGGASMSGAMSARNIGTARLAATRL